MQAIDWLRILSKGANAERAAGGDGTLYGGLRPVADLQLSGIWPLLYVCCVSETAQTSVNQWLIIWTSTVVVFSFGL